MNTEHSFPVSSVDASVAFDCEGNRAQSEGFSLVAERQHATALHIRNAVAHMQEICPKGYRVETRITFAFVLDVNPVLRDDVRENRATHPSPKLPAN